MMFNPSVKDKCEKEERYLFGNKFRKKLEKKPFYKAMTVEIRLGSKEAVAAGYHDKIAINMAIMDFLVIGGVMEKDGLLLKEINKEAEESRDILRNLANDIRKTQDLVLPELQKMVRKIRDNRTSCTLELNKSLSLLKDIRKFFLDRDHEKEIERLKEFVILAEKIKALIDDGTMDAICDIILKLESKGD